MERLALQHGVSLRKDGKFQALVGRLGQSGPWLMLPQSFMNASGRPVQMLAGFFKIPAAEILVVHDEIEFPPGVARLKQGGGIAGHNGLRDISQRIATHDYWRLRLGVGHPGAKGAVADYVLGKPVQEEREAIDEAIGRALEVMPQIVAGEMQAAMLKLHTDPKPRPAPKVEPKPEPKVEPKSEPKAAPKAESKPEPKPESKPEAKPEAKPAEEKKGLFGSLFGKKK